MHPHLMARLSLGAYYDNPEDVIDVADRGLFHVDTVIKSDTECAVFQLMEDSRPALIFSFRGTEGPRFRDWITNLKAHKSPFWAGSHVHTGFLESVDNVWSKLRKIIYRFPKYALWLTGHSKGAAEATITAAKAALSGFTPEGLITFGSPRVGDKQFAVNLNLLFNGRSLRYVHNNDVVARVPLSLGILTQYIPYGKLLEHWIPFGFKHVGNLRHITATGDILSPKGIRDKFRIAYDHVAGRVIAGKDWWNDGLRDHDIDLYCEAVKNEPSIS